VHIEIVDYVFTFKFLPCSILTCVLTNIFKYDLHYHGYVIFVQIADSFDDEQLPISKIVEKFLKRGAEDVTIKVRAFLNKEKAFLGRS
jgi:hypothetical protein